MRQNIFCTLAFGPDHCSWIKLLFRFSSATRVCLCLSIQWNALDNVRRIKRNTRSGRLLRYITFFTEVGSQPQTKQNEFLIYLLSSGFFLVQKLVCTAIETVEAFEQVLFLSFICIAPSAHAFFISPTRKCSKCEMPFFLSLPLWNYNLFRLTKQSAPFYCSTNPTQQCNWVNSASGALHLSFFVVVVERHMQQNEKRNKN